jgi:hypothetical protein
LGWPTNLKKSTILENQVSKPVENIIDAGAEKKRLKEADLQQRSWKRWGPYLSERQWGTVREDYSENGDCWSYFPHDAARSRAYRWGEDGLMGISDRQGRMCFALALWNGKDPILKERLYGLNGHEGNHGEDVKEEYFYLDSSPTHSWMKGLYKYPQMEYPYEELLKKNQARTRLDPEFELRDSGAFADDKYFDVEVKYAKCKPNDILIEIVVSNRGPDLAELQVLPTLWFRNTWSWKQDREDGIKPELRYGGKNRIESRHTTLGRFFFDACPLDGVARVPAIFTENETRPVALGGNPILPQEESEKNPNSASLDPSAKAKQLVEPVIGEAILNKKTTQENAAGVDSKIAEKQSPASAAAKDLKGPIAAEMDLSESRFNLPNINDIEAETDAEIDDTPILNFYKDAFHHYIINDCHQAVNPNRQGTKCAYVYTLKILPGESKKIQLRIYSDNDRPAVSFGKEFDELMKLREKETDEFYATTIPESIEPEKKMVMRQAYAGLLWSKQFYYYIVRDWLKGDGERKSLATSPRYKGRNKDWTHMYNRDIISMPDKWEYPWYAAWDLAFHMIPLTKIDQKFAEQQLLMFLRENYMHPNGQIPAYEFAFGDVNPPVHAWACWRIYKASGPKGKRNRQFLAETFQKLLLNFTWWVNQKDVEGKNLFSGGFLGLDNITVFDRSNMPQGMEIIQADGTAWMAFYCGTMLRMALELASENKVYEGMAVKFFNHFLSIASSMNTVGGEGLWDEEDGFYYDRVLVNGYSVPLKVRSMVGIIPLFAATILSEEVIMELPYFEEKMNWMLDEFKDLSRNISWMEATGEVDHHRYLLAIPSRRRLKRVLAYVLDEKEFLSPYGVRSLSKIHLDHPVVFMHEGKEYKVSYNPAESTSSLFGGNSNWRGPIWFPLNHLLIESLWRYYDFYGESFKVECPTGSGCLMTLKEVAYELSRRLTLLFLKDEKGNRPCYGSDPKATRSKSWDDLVQFHEYFNAETGEGLGAAHQTGWTSLVINCFETMDGLNNA